MKRFIKFYVRFVQKILITIFLTLLYFIAFSITKFFMFVFPRKHKQTINKNSYWLTAEGYTSDMESALEQS